MKPVGTITYVARQTGLSIHVIRVWEKRYGAVQPLRASNNRRLYSQEDIERLQLLREATLAGYAIGQIARATHAELEALIRESDRPPFGAQALRHRQIGDAVELLTHAAIDALLQFDALRFTKVLQHAAADLGSPAVLQKFIAPLAERVGDLWRDGEVSIAHEHFATRHITEFLAAFARPYHDGASAPHLVLGTPSGQMHELGAIIVAAGARSHGWRTTYLGAALPIEEFVGAVRYLQPRAAGLSIVFPPDDEALRGDLRKLAELLPNECKFLVGGRSAESYADTLREIKATLIPRLEDLYPVLEQLQRRK